MADDGFKIKTGWRFLGFLLLVFFLYSIVSYLVHDAWTDAGQGKVFTSDKSSDTVVARAWVERPSSDLKGQFRCWVSLENLTGKPVDQVQFAAVRRFHSEKNKPTDVDEIEKSVNRDLVLAFQGRPGAAVRALAPGDRQTFWTTFQAPEAEGEYEILSVFEWTQEGKLAQNSLLVGPLETPGMKSRVLRAGNSLYVIWKDLALPVALVALTFLFSQWGDYAADRRKREETAAEEVRGKAKEEAETRQKKEEKERDQDRLVAERQKERESRELERHTEQVRETLARMLVVSRRDTQRFYLPLLASSSLLMARLKQDRDGWKQEAFFHLMTFLRVMQRLKDENGGLYLKSRKGEKVISSAWWLFKPAAEKRFTPEKYAAAIEEAGSRESYARFLTELPNRPALKHCKEAFESWLEPAGQDEIAFAAYLPAFEIFYVTLKYEVDRPLIYWYGEADPSPRAELTPYKDQLLAGKLADGARETQIDVEIEEYLKELDSEVPRFNARMRRIRGEEGV